MTEDRLGAVLRVLKGAGRDLDPQEVLDVLWLARLLPADSGSPLPLERARRDAGGPSAAPVPERPETDEDDRDEPAVPPSDADLPDLTSPELHAATRPPPAPERRLPPGADEGRPSLPMRVPEEKALANELLIGRALRPLKRRQPSRWRQELDEAATAAALAETRLPDVVMRPARERWLHLALVVDDGMSMLLWHRLTVELLTAMQRLGAFRSIRVMGLDTRTAEAPQLRGQPFAPDSSAMSPSTIQDPSGQTLVIVFSDGMGAAWRRGTMHDVLLGWAAGGPVAVVHALPPALWIGSGIQAERWQATTRRPGGANTSWEITDRILPAGLADFAGVPVPVLEPTPESLRDWTRLLTSPGTTVELPLLGRPGRYAPIARPQEISSVQHFRDAASPEAYRLAAHLAAVSPVSVPVMRLVQSAVPWPARTAHLAEVFLGGLIHPFPAPVDGPLPAKHRVFDFSEESKSALLDAVPSSELLRTSRRIGRRLEQLAGRSPDFPAWLAHPHGMDTLPPAYRSFTAVERRLMTRFGVTVPAPEPVPEVVPGAPRAEQWSPLTPQDPVRLGGYTLLSRRPGGRSVVYLGRDVAGEQAALRTIRPELPSSNEQLLVTEAEVLRRMNGRYAPVLVDSGLDDRPPWLAMRLFSSYGVSGGQPDRLGDLLGYERRDGSGAFDILTSLTLGWHLAAALSICHLAGLVPADLTPDSVIVLPRSILLGGLSDCAVDGEYAGAGPVPTEADSVRELGELLRLISSKPRQPLPGLTEGMHLWQGDTWRPLRELVLQCLAPDPAERPTAAEASDVLARYVAIATGGGSAPTAGTPARGGGEQGPPARPRLTPLPVGRDVTPAKRVGRRAIRLNLGDGRAEYRRQLGVVQRTLTYSRRITVVGAQPNCGRASTTYMLGSLLAAVREEPVLALDGAPAAGDLHVYVTERAGTPRDLMSLSAEAAYEHLRRVTGQTPSGLELLVHRANHSSPSPVHAEEYRRVLAMTARHYPVVLTDWAPHWLDSTANVVLDLTDRLVVCCANSEYSVNAAAQILTGLRTQGWAELSAGSVVVVTKLGGIDKPMAYGAVEQRLADLAAEVVLVPFDLHLAGAGAKELGRLRSRTADAFLKLATLVVGDPA